MNQLRAKTISIHALLAESDPLCRFSFSAGRISIHALLAESDSSLLRFSVSEVVFLSTLSLRRATPNPVCIVVAIIFLSTLSLRRATSALGGTTMPEVYFYPRSPCGERLAPKQNPTEQRDFYPRSPCGERPGKIWSTAFAA